MTIQGFERIAAEQDRRAEQHLDRAVRATAEGNPGLAADRARKAALCRERAARWRAMQSDPNTFEGFVLEFVAGRMLVDMEATILGPAR